MKSSLKFIASLVGVAGLSLSISLPTLAQSSPSPNDPSPSPGSGTMNQTDPIPSPGAGTTNQPGSMDQPGMMNQPGSMDQPGTMNQPYQGQTPDSTYQPAATIPSNSDSMSVAALVDETPSLTLFNSLLRVAAIEEPELLTKLTGNGDDYTIFAPTDRAFAALPEGTIRALVQPENRDLLVRLLSYHIVPGDVSSADIASADLGSTDLSNGLTPPSGDLDPSDSTANTTNPNRDRISLNGDNMSSPGGSPTADSTLDQQDGLTPPSGDLNPNENPGNVDRSQVIEPTEAGDNDSSPRITADNSGTVMFDQARVVGSDIQAKNGIIHPIDRVIVPPALQAELQEAVSGEVATPAPTSGQ